MADSAKMKLLFADDAGDETSKFINNINPAAENAAIVSVGKTLASLQKYSLVALSKTIVTDLDLTAAE